MAEPDAEFFARLPRSRSAASALLTDDQGRVLLVAPTYKPGWSLPGGVVEADESPWAACRRECAEELGFVPRLTGGLVCVDWQPPHTAPDHRPSTIYVFAGPLAAGDFAAVRLPEDELRDARMVAPGDLGGHLSAARSRRVARALAAAAAGTTAYLEHGHPVGAAD
ncbi:NUDIX domain-containing protein [Nocardiopsis trehalosi]|jgi:8-oxo-dGTP pyrophosphatase MutT (NUDIX family)|uniref:NUDIX domain-containing protein n=1 Tax=Nocardiopsis trehalosi TaxID=109329 RepID=UPI0008310135|nr:NUDIX hydrolase [Nocardiopsis trehalosi]